LPTTAAARTPLRSSAFSMLGTPQIDQNIRDMEEQINEDQSLFWDDALDIDEPEQFFRKISRQPHINRECLLKMKLKAEFKRY